MTNEVRRHLSPTRCVSRALSTLLENPFSGDQADPTAMSEVIHSVGQAETPTSPRSRVVAIATKSAVFQPVTSSALIAPDRSARCRWTRSSVLVLTYWRKPNWSNIYC
jgi:hypothetical protein